MTDQTPQAGQAARLRKLLDQPFVGFAPWVLLSVVEGPGRLVLAAALAWGLALATTVAGTVLGQRPKVPDITAIVFFGALTALAAVADPGTSRWLGDWASEVSNVAIALIAGLSLALRHPFTLQYARETTPQEYWASPLFLRVNYVITAVWSVVFALIAVVGYIGDGLLHQPDNIWTNWLIQIGLVVLAFKFTAWYPEHATGGTQPGRPPTKSSAGHPAELLKPLAAYLVPVGIVVMVVAGSTWWVGAVLIVVGVVTTRRLHQASRTTGTATAAEEPGPS